MTEDDPPKLEDANCLTAPTDQNSYMNQGCFKKINDELNDEIDTIIAVVVCVFSVELLAAVFAFCLCHATGKEKSYNTRPHYQY